eukprot:SAG31_NODE_3211_length_4548_cov_3.394695_5_plen_147_part_00
MQKQVAALDGWWVGVLEALTIWTNDSPLHIGVRCEERWYIRCIRDRSGIKRMPTLVVCVVNISYQPTCTPYKTHTQLCFVCSQDRAMASTWGARQLSASGDALVVLCHGKTQVRCMRTAWCVGIIRMLNVIVEIYFPVPISPRWTS